MKKVAKDFVRAQVLERTTHYWSEVEGNEVLPVGSGSFSMPVVGPDGEEGFVTVTVVVRDKDREGNVYDGYADSKAYAEELADKRRLAAEKAEEKARQAALRAARKAAKEKTE